MKSHVVIIVKCLNTFAHIGYSVCLLCKILQIAHVEMKSNTKRFVEKISPEKEQSRVTYMSGIGVSDRGSWMGLLPHKHPPLVLSVTAAGLRQQAQRADDGLGLPGLNVFRQSVSADRGN